MKALSGIVIACLLAFINIAQANDFPTQARVEYVLGCMKQQGGENYNSLYRCVCMIDTIAAHFSHDEFAAARTFTLLRRTPGERGGVFRDPPQAKALVKKLREVNETAATSCLAG